MADSRHTTTFNVRAIMQKAWDGYRKMARVMKETSFNRSRFVFELRMAWAVAKELAAVPAKPAAVVAPVKALHPAAAARAADIQSALFDLQMGNFVDWTRYGALSIELAQLAA